MALHPFYSSKEIQNIKRQRWKSWQLFLGTRRDLFSSIFCLEETPQMLQHTVIPWKEYIEQFKTNGEECWHEESAYCMTMRDRPQLASHGICCRRLSPSYSRDLAPSDYHLFGNLTEHIAARKLYDDDEAKDEVLRWLNEQVADFYNSSIKKLLPTLKTCIEKYGDYVEK